jgi:hypothetical protein
MEKYFVFYLDDDGEITVSEHDEKSIQKYLDESYHGEAGFVKDVEMLKSKSAKTSCTMIIKGKCVIPKAKKVVYSYEL